MPSTDTDAAAQRRQKIKEFASNFSILQLIDPSQPWVLVENGSFLGLFDWVPYHFRNGPWSIAAVAYICFFGYSCGLAGVYFLSDLSQPWFPLLSDDDESTSSFDSFSDHLTYSPLYSAQWYYHVFACVWMIYIVYLLLVGPNGAKAWATYTVQSWTLLTFRHALCAMAPFDKTALNLAELIRFPAACSATITFCVWNFMLMPFIYFFGLKTAEARSGFLKFATSFRLSNIHLLNIVLCSLNCGPWGSPRRRLEWIDFYGAFMSVMVYMAWYLFVLDRLGIHMYPIFSPRTGTVAVLLAWSALVLIYMGTFHMWRWFTDVTGS